MPTCDDLTGLGVAGQLAEALGNQPLALGTLGTSQTASATIRSTNIELIASSSQTGAILPASAKVGTPYYVFCSSSTAGIVYAPSGQYLNGAQNGSVTLAQNKSTILIQYKRNYWMCQAAA